MENIRLFEAETCSKQDSLDRVMGIMKEKKQRRVFVIENEKLVGIITTVDVVNKLAGIDKKPSEIKAEEVMTSPVESVTKESNLDDALTIMNKMGTFVCPVTENGKLLGIITYPDIISNVLKKIRK